MNPMWMAATYLVDRARGRAQAARDGHPESGALSLEWLVIAVALVAAVAIAALIFNNAIKSETANLP